MSHFVEFYIQGFPLCFYMIDPCKFVVKVDTKVTDDFRLYNHIIVENYGEEEQRPRRKEKVMCVDLLGFILIFHKSNQF